MKIFERIYKDIEKKIKSHEEIDLSMHSRYLIKAVSQHMLEELLYKPMDDETKKAMTVFYRLIGEGKRKFKYVGTDIFSKDIRFRGEFRPEHSTYVLCGKWLYDEHCNAVAYYE